MRSVRSIPSKYHHFNYSTSGGNHGRKYRRAEFATCRIHQLRSGLDSVTNALWERTGRAFRRQFGFQKTEDMKSGAKEEATSQQQQDGKGASEPKAWSALDAPEGVIEAAEASRGTESGSSSAGADSSSAGAGAGANAGSTNTNGSGGGVGSGGYSTPSLSRSPALRLEVSVVDSISKVSREEWDAVATRCGGGGGDSGGGGEVNPFLLWSFLHALEDSGSASPRTGWLPQHILVRQILDEHPPGNTAGMDCTALGRGDPAAAVEAAEARQAASAKRLVGCVPMYLKGHSYGEYVFDNSWADFASMLGVRYYPKLQAGVPFTPVSGPRLMVSNELPPADRAAVVRALGKTLIDMAESLGVSGVHLTFTTAQEWAVLGELGFRQRLGIQFHWDNNEYDSFEDFLGELKQSKRKSIRQERRSIERSGLSVHRLSGHQLGAAHWDRFHSFYLATVNRKWGNAYLTREFFHRLGEDLADRVLLVAAFEDSPSPHPSASSSSSSSYSSSSPPPADKMVAGALNLVGSHALFGRNWGQLEGREYRNLHFELCYYQVLEEAISRRLPRVEAGAQGEHKLQRGYLPSFTYSCHYLRDPRLGAVVDRFLSRERTQIEYALKVMSVTSSPYKEARTVTALVGKLRSYNSVSSGSFDTDNEEGKAVAEGEGQEGGEEQEGASKEVVVVADNGA
ncbi:hypothetical protein VOLCADRAFT_104149 [Volvox carteri f. nagariensis]|uniref:Uncharacterized protein n=1 Tax=Volvox carteri f. nagariensis TaxID=3068 RepID=D8TRL0_VOLCA|nr:uncharacterized protein VOLCADRAFT_104149 [Volvox carteri f. nagariensis]EFJ49911.1 hypothetical protein VOLCADRAFT_104149 [Volvox carteri f. nagariensis]|eukprot:XP_002948976.1 hypothetical protein VOLCADRAFT_104149 [Volvox carteri f. nagariensis]